MKLAFWILFFGFALNASAGLVYHYVPNVDTNSENIRGLNYRPDDITTFSNELNSTIDSSSTATDTSNLIDNILDKLNLGIIKKLQVWADQWMFGFTNMIGGTVLGLAPFTMGIINSILIIVYVLAFINMFSGKLF